MADKRYVRIDDKIHDISDYVHSCFIYINNEGTATELYMSQEIDLELIGNFTWVEYEDGTKSNEHIITSIAIPNKDLSEYVDRCCDPIMYKVAQFRQLALSHNEDKLSFENTKNPKISFPIGRGYILYLERVFWYKNETPSFRGEEFLLTITDANNNILVDISPDIDLLNGWIEALTMLVNPTIEDIMNNKE